MYVYFMSQLLTLSHKKIQVVNISLVVEMDCEHSKPHLKTPLVNTCTQVQYLDFWGIVHFLQLRQRDTLFMQQLTPLEKVNLIAKCLFNLLQRWQACLT